MIFGATFLEWWFSFTFAAIVTRLLVGSWNDDEESY